MSEEKSRIDPLTQLCNNGEQEESGGSGKPLSIHLK